LEDLELAKASVADPTIITAELSFPKAYMVGRFARSRG
jgi:hypothetical protein